MKQNIMRTLGVAVIAAIVAAGCGSDDNSSEKASAGNERLPSSPPKTLAEDVFGDAVSITDSSETHDGDVTIDRATGAIYVTWAEDTGSEEIVAGVAPPQDLYFAKSTDGGKTFTEPLRVNKEPGTVTAGLNWQSKVVATGDDRVLVTWPYANNDFVYKVRSQLSTDGGETFGDFVGVSDKGGDETSDGYQGVATWGKNVYVGYIDYSSGATGIQVVKSGDGGRTYDEPVDAESTSCQCCDNGLVADSKGTLFFAYRNLDQQTSRTQIRDTAVLRSYDQGVSWSDPVVLGDDNWEFNGCPEGGPELAVDGDDNLHGVYWTGLPGRPGVYYVRSTDGGTSFAKPKALGVAEFYPPAYMDIASENDGTSWATWDDRRTKTKYVHLARIDADGEVETLDGPMGEGLTPAVDSDGSMVVMTWSDEDGFHVRTRGEAAKDGYGSGRGSASSGQEQGHGHGGH